MLITVKWPQVSVVLNKQTDCKQFNEYIDNHLTAMQNPGFYEFSFYNEVKWCFYYTNML